MAMIEFEEGAIQVGATIVAEGLGIESSLVQECMREGKITSLCERGADEDARRYRLTSFSENRRFLLVVDETAERGPMSDDQFQRPNSSRPDATAGRMSSVQRQRANNGHQILG